MPNRGIAATDPLVASASTASITQLPQIEVMAYFTSLAEHLVSGDGIMERFSKELDQKLEYLRHIELQSESYRGTSTSQRQGKLNQHSLLAQALSGATPATGETLLHLAARYVFIIPLRSFPSPLITVMTINSSASPMPTPTPKSWVVISYRDLHFLLDQNIRLFRLINRDPS